MAKVNAKGYVYLAMVTLTFIVYQVTLYHYQDDIPTFTKNIPLDSLLSAYNTISVTTHPSVVATRLKERRDRMRKACEEVDHPKTITKTLATILYAPSHDMFVCASPNCERSSVAARCNVATTAYVKALHSRATPPPSDVAATHRPYIRCPLDASQRQSNDLPATTNQPPPAPP
ncbi:hypothetical protein Pcinc_005262 [Petrolisthes cinctipes]|uniref:Uncharacterized protein n=1 Tax=Petrolisthes cinctipes TaxID=88211 RepID=A0AAE1GDY0_PETCI|nr:hypothetical protein Pcinc_005262 [Petrolisthes cinctipes]